MLYNIKSEYITIVYDEYIYCIALSDGSFQDNNILSTGISDRSKLIYIINLYKNSLLLDIIDHLSISWWNRTISWCLTIWITMMPSSKIYPYLILKSNHRSYLVVKILYSNWFIHALKLTLSSSTFIISISDVLIVIQYNLSNIVLTHHKSHHHFLITYYISFNI